MAITIKTGGDQSQLSAAGKAVNKLRAWAIRLNGSSQWEVYDPVTGLLTAACDTTKEAGYVISNLATYGHVQPGLAAA